MKSPWQAFIEVPKDIGLDERAMLIGRLVSLYRGTHEPHPIHIGCDCYKVATLGDEKKEIEQKLTEGLHIEEKLLIVFSDEEHITPAASGQVGD